MKNYEKYRPGYFTPPMNPCDMEWTKKTISKKAPGGAV